MDESSKKVIDGFREKAIDGSSEKVIVGFSEGVFDICLGWSLWSLWISLLMESSTYLSNGAFRVYE